MKEFFVPYAKQHPAEKLSVVMRDVLRAYFALPEEQKAPYIQVRGWWAGWQLEDQDVLFTVLLGQSAISIAASQMALLDRSCLA